MIILSIPLILYIIYVIFKKSKKTKKKSKQDPERQNLIDPQEDINEEGEKNSVFIRFLKIFFNIKKNGKELFNFSAHNTDSYNNTGLNYSKGLMGISIIFTILGQIYFILYNLPMKDFGQSHFYNFFELHQILFFIGLRYSPRIIFSCSGFILTYKYLSFLSENKNSKIIYFFLRQTYKYILFVLIVLFWRFSVYEIIIFIFNRRPVSDLFNNVVLNEPENIKDFFLSLLSIKSFEFEGNDSRLYHYLIDYFWMPINEIIFFIFGMILLTIGFKCKIRIDIFIPVLILILVSLKIFYFYCFKEEKGLYSTLYYYLFDYGRLMINPLFNLSYYLIGIFYGFNNYCIQKGIINLYKEDMFTKMNMESEEDES